jgi:hypothetical protein
LAEAAQSESAAMQLQKQIQFVTDGPFGKVVANAQQAYKLFEGMKSGDISGVMPEGFKQKATSDAMRVAEAKTSDAYSPIKMMMNEADRARQLAGQKAGETIGMNFGRGNEENLNAQKRLMEAERSADNIHKITNEWVKTGNVMQNINRSMALSAFNFSSATSDAGKVITNGFQKMGTELTKFLNQAKEAFGATVPNKDKKEDKQVLLPITIVMNTATKSFTAKPGDEIKPDATGAGTSGR